MYDTGADNVMRTTLCEITRKIKENKKIILFAFVTVMLWGAIICMVKLDLSTKVLRYTSHKSNQNQEQFIHDFVDGMEIRQKFENYTDFDFVTMCFSDHDQRLGGKIIIQVVDAKSDELLISQEREVSSIKYNVPVEVSFENSGGGKANREYEIRLYSSTKYQTALGVFGYQTKENSAVVNGEETEYALSLGIHSYTNLYVIILRLILGIAMIAFVFVGVIIFKFQIQPQNMFLMIAVPFSICMLIMWPGNSVYDEERHYHTVYHYSNVILGCGSEDTVDQIRMRYEDITDKSVLKELGSATNAQAQSFWYFINKISDKISDNSTVLVDVSDSPVVYDGNIIQYLPGVCGMTIARLLNCNYFWMMTITRFSIMLFYFGMCYYAIGKIPILKTLVAFVAAIPTNLYQASGISYDSFTFAVGIVVFSFIIKLWYVGLERRDWIKYAIAVVALANCKGGVYLTLTLLMILIPKERYVNRKWLKCLIIYLIAGATMVIAFLPTVIVWFIVNPQTPNVSEVINSGGMIAEKFSVIFVLQEPAKFLRMFLKTMINNLDVYIGQMLGYRTAWANETISLVVMLPFLILLIFSAIRDEREKFELKITDKVGIFGILLIELVGMQIIFLGETPTYSDVILGFQGRYFILFIPCILLLFRDENVVYQRRKDYLYLYFSVAQIVYLYFFLEMFMLA